jgi:uncharacterized protein YfeS
MPEEKPRLIKKMALLDGSRVGINNLDTIIKEVIGLKLTDTATIKKELLERVKECNYIAPSAEDDYAAALLLEYEVKTGKVKPAEEKHKHGAG